MAKWYYKRNNNQVGPIEESVLLDFMDQNVLKKDDLVRSEKREDWKKISSIPQFNKTDSTDEYEEELTRTNDKTLPNNYAGFWLRLGACVIDVVILFIFNSIIAGLLQLEVFNKMGEVGPIILFSNPIFIISSWLYYALMESSKKQATLGKLALGIKVTDEETNPVGFGKGTGRFFGKFLSMLIIYIGFIMIAFTEKKQGLHDIMAGCLVVKG